MTFSIVHGYSVQGCITCTKIQWCYSQALLIYALNFFAVTMPISWMSRYVFLLRKNTQCSRRPHVFLLSTRRKKLLHFWTPWRWCTVSTFSYVMQSCSVCLKSKLLLYRKSSIILWDLHLWSSLWIIICLLVSVVVANVALTCSGSCYVCTHFVCSSQNSDYC